MNAARDHKKFGLLFGLVVLLVFWFIWLQFYWQSFAFWLPLMIGLYFVGVWIGATIPDNDIHLKWLGIKHRGKLFHSWGSAIIGLSALSVLAFFVSRDWAFPAVCLFAVSLFIGVSSHLVADGIFAFWGRG